MTANTTTITTTAKSLRDLLAPVIPLADIKGWSLPIINAVHLRGHGDQITATATDRYRVGVCRAPIAAPEGFDAVLPISSAKAILGTFKATRAFDPELELTFDGLVVHVTTGGFGNIEGARIGYRLIDGEYPKVGAIITEAFRGGIAAGTGVSAALLADFAAAVRDGSPARLYASDDALRPIGITVGDHFVGAIMPVRMAEDGAIGGPPLDPWEALLDSAPVEAEAVPA